MIAVVSAAWALVVLTAASRRVRSFDPGRLPSAGPGGEGPLGRVGELARRRVTPLGSLAPSTVGAAVVGLVVVAPWQPLVAIGGAAALVGAGVVAGATARSRRARRLVEAAPGGWELLRLAVDGGLTSTEAVAAVSTGLDDPFGDLLGEIDQRIGRGDTLANAIDSVARASGAVVAQPLGMVAAAHRSGASVSVALARAAERQRAELRRMAEARARRLPVLLLLPLVSCVLPSFALLTVVPMVAGGLDGLELP